MKANQRLPRGRKRKEKRVEGQLRFQEIPQANLKQTKCLTKVTTLTLNKTSKEPREEGEKCSKGGSKGYC